MSPKQIGVVTLHHNRRSGDFGEALHLESQTAVRERGSQVLQRLPFDYRHHSIVDDGGVVTSRQRSTLGRADAATAVAAVNTEVTVALNQTQFDALVSFVFNVGTGHFHGSTLLRNLNTGDYLGVPHELARWNRANNQVSLGVTLRRQLESRLFEQGVY